MGIDTAESGGALPYLKVHECTCVSVSGERESELYCRLGWWIILEKRLWPDAKQETNSLLGQVNRTAKSIIITPNLFIHTKSFSKRLCLFVQACSVRKAIAHFPNGCADSASWLNNFCLSKLYNSSEEMLRPLKKQHTPLWAVYIMLLIVRPIGRWCVRVLTGSSICFCALACLTLK